MLHYFSVIGFILLAVNPVGAREWAQRDGATVDAELVGVRDDVLTLQTEAGRFTIAMKDLVTKDRVFVWRWMETKTGEDSREKYPKPSVKMMSRKGYSGGGMIVGGSTDKRNNTITLNVTAGSSAKMKSGILSLPYFYDSSDLDLLVVKKSQTDGRITDKDRKKGYPMEVPPVPKDVIAALADNLARLSEESKKPLQMSDPKAAPKQILNAHEALKGVVESILVKRFQFLAVPKSGFDVKWEFKHKFSRWRGELLKTDRQLFDEPRSRLSAYVWQPELKLDAVARRFHTEVAIMSEALATAADEKSPARRAKWAELFEISNGLSLEVAAWRSSTHEWYFPLDYLGIRESVRNSQEYYFDLTSSGKSIYTETTR